MTKTRMVLAVLAVLLGALMVVANAPDAQLSMRARDPGPRGGPDARRRPDARSHAAQLAIFEAGPGRLREEEGVGDGLGPRFNLDSCGGCHSSRHRRHRAPR